MFNFVLCFGLFAYSVFAAVPEPKKYVLSYPTGDNYLNITVDPDPTKNYIILIGDWAPDRNQSNETTHVKIQDAVANKMKSFYKKQKSAGMNLLFVATVGDNFYYGGNNCSMFKNRWTDIYGEIATDYYWLSVFGNHDWGANDPHAICAWGFKDPYILPSTNIPYAGNQINKDKHGCNPDNYWLPDYGYYYTINELNFEIIMLEETVTICPNDNGKQNYKDCNNSAKVGCEYLGKMRDASEEMMLDRAVQSKNTNFLLAQHYPSNGKRLIHNFTSARGGSNSKNDQIWSIFGHTHYQECQHKDNNGVCDCILTGGAAMGSGGDEALKGFYVIGFDKNKNMIQPYKFNDPEISCEFPCGTNPTDEQILQMEYNDCCYLSSGIDCHRFDLSKC
eukprot:492064_1